MGIPYNLDKPNKVYELPDALLEISGIHPIGMSHLACVEDEHRNIYLFDLNAGTISHRFGLSEEGDAEDIVILDDAAYVLFATKREIYKYEYFRASMSKPEKYDLKIKKDHDPEGLCYDVKRNHLLVVCKGSPNADSTKRRVFRFDLEDGILRKKPLFTIDGKDIHRCASAKKTFNPSGIAIHPETRDIYMIGTRGWKMVIRLEEHGQRILGKKKLDRKIFRQPEGITFSESGELFISSEGKEGKKGRTNKPAKIFRFASSRSKGPYR